MALNDKQKRFCEEYVIDFNQTRSYKAAYPSIRKDNTAAAAAAKLLRNVNVQNYLSELKQEALDNNKVTAQMVIDELAKLAFHNVKDFVNGGNSILEIKMLPTEKTAAVSGIKTSTRMEMVKDEKGRMSLQPIINTQLKFHSKDKALQLLGQHFGIFEKDNSQKKSDPVILNFNRSEGCEPLTNAGS